MDSRPLYKKDASVSVRPANGNTTLQSGERLKQRDLTNLYFSGLSRVSAIYYNIVQLKKMTVERR